MHAEAKADSARVKVRSCFTAFQDYNILVLKITARSAFVPLLRLLFYVSSWHHSVKDVGVTR